MHNKPGKALIKGVGVTELLIGLITLSGHMLYSLTGADFKPVNVLLFIFVTSTLSFFIGVGILRHNKLARIILVFFSGYIVFTKILIFFGLLKFTGDIIIIISPGFKDFASFCYHVFIVIFFLHPQIKRQFDQKL